MACWFAFLSLIFTKMNNENVNIIELFQRVIIGLFIGLMNPIFAISYGLNNFLFGEPIRPITKLFIGLWYYAIGTDKFNNDIPSPL
jgi:hypothetical protein